MWPIPDYVPIIVNSCPFSRLDGGLDMLNEAGEDAVNWLESTTVQPQIIQKLHRWTVFKCYCYNFIYVFGYGQGWQNMH